jgi:hypothetical protein
LGALVFCTGKVTVLHVELINGAAVALSHISYVYRLNMSFDTLSPRANVPDEINVIIEIPANSDPVKYKIDKDIGTLIVDRFMASPIF